MCIKIPEIIFKRKGSVLIFLFFFLLTESEQLGGAPMVTLRLLGKGKTFKKSIKIEAA